MGARERGEDARVWCSLAEVERHVVELVQVLRASGLPVAISETEDALRALELVDPLDLESVRAALQASLCKRLADRERFAEAFAWIFASGRRTLEAIDRAWAARLQDEGLLEGDGLAMVLAQLRTFALGLSPLARALVEGDRSRTAALLRDAVLRLNFAQGLGEGDEAFYGRRLLRELGLESARGELDTLLRALEEQGLSPGQLEQSASALGAALRGVEDAAREELRAQRSFRQARGQGYGEGRPRLASSPEAMRAAHAAVRAVAERLRTRLQRRQRSRRRGSLHPTKTVRRSLAFGGVPIQPQFRRRPARRAELVVLCDVSESVRDTTQLMLSFAWCLQSFFRRVRSFVFVADLAEVTQTFVGSSVEEALERALGGELLALSGNSNYGRAFERLLRAAPDALTQQTTLLVIGDGRTNFFPRRLDLLARLRRRVRRIVWLVPEPKARWGTGDSEMPAYARAVHQAIPVTGISELERLGDRLVMS